MIFGEYGLAADSLLIGERIKKGTYRPVIPEFTVNGEGYRAIPYSTASGALRDYLGLRWDVPVHAAGYLCPAGKVDALTIAPRDAVTGVSKLPITVEFLTGVRGKLFVLLDEHTDRLPKRFQMFMGGMRYKGLGLVFLERTGEINEPSVGSGSFLTRIPETEAHHFGIEASGAAKLGYLFKPTAERGGVYVRSLFEGSQVRGYRFLVEVQ